MRAWSPPAAVATLTFAAFLPSLWNGFVNYDDPHNLLDNPNFRGFGWENLRWMFTAHEGLYMPLTWLSYAFDHALWGMRATGYHLSSLLLHVVNAVLVYALVRRLVPSADLWSAAAGALLFAVHPLRVESVAWATERRDVLSGAFLLLSMLAYLPDAEGRRRTTLSAVLYACSLLSKGMALLFPVALLFVDWWQKRDVRRALPEKIPFALLAAGAIAMAFVAQERAQALTATTWDHRLMQPTYRVAFYSWKTVAPFGLSPLYLFRGHESAWQARYVLAFVAVAAATAALFVWRARRPGAWVAWAIALLLLAPSLGVIQVGPHGPADRYTYLAALPLSMAAAAALERPIARGLAAAVLVAAGALTSVQCAVWRDSERLWTHALALDPEHHVAYYNRGHHRFERGDLRGALADFDAAVRVAPPKPPARLFVNRAAARLGAGDPAGALADCSTALKLDGGLAEAHANAGLALEQMGHPDRAREAYRKARELAPAGSDLRRAMDREIDRLSR